MTRRKNLVAFTLVALVTLASIGSAQAQGNGAQPADPWPRQFKLSNAPALVYQPQVDSWENNMLNFRAVVSITPNGAKQEILGVIWATARTQVNRVSRIVVLEDIKLTKTTSPPCRTTARLTCERCSNSRFPLRKLFPWIVCRHPWSQLETFSRRRWW